MSAVFHAVRIVSSPRSVPSVRVLMATRTMSSGPRTSCLASSWKVGSIASTWAPGVRGGPQREDDQRGREPAAHQPSSARAASAISSRSPGAGVHGSRSGSAS